MTLLRALLGLAFFCAAAWAFSSHRRRFPWRVVLLGILAQVVLGLLVLKTAAGEGAVQWAAGAVRKLISMAEPGTRLVFGPLADFDKMSSVFGPDSAFIFAFAGTGLIAIIFFSALMGVLYHLGIMQVLVYLMAKAMTFLMGVSGAESMAMAANVFVGQTEAPLVVRPYIERMTRSELNALMTGGFATIAGSVLAVYIGLLGPEYGPHLLTASVMSAPAAFVMAKIMLPETEESVTGKQVHLRIERTANNVIEAAANGTTDGLKLWLNVIAMLIAFMGLITLADHLLGWVAGGLTLRGVFGWIFSPIAWLMGVDGWHDCRVFGSLLGAKISINEFIAFDQLTHVLPGKGEGALLHHRTAEMAAYALCGFANFASIGIQIGGITPLAPGRKHDIARLALRAMIGGAFASWMTATVAGAFL